MWLCVSAWVCVCACVCLYQRACVSVCAWHRKFKRKKENGIWSNILFGRELFPLFEQESGKGEEELPWISIRLEVTALKVASNGEWTWLIHTISLPKKLHCRSKSNLSYSVAEANEPDSTVIVSSRRNSTTIKGKETMREAFPSLPFGLPELEKQQQSSQQQQQQQRHHHYSSKDLTTGEIITSMCFLRSHRRTVLDIACFSPFTKCTAISQSSS